MGRIKGEDMAEYIDREELSVTPIDITDLPTDKCLMVYLAEDVDSLPTADVVERSKINKAIEEIRECSISDFEYHGCGGSQLIVETEDVIEILKRIGE